MLSSSNYNQNAHASTSLELSIDLQRFLFLLQITVAGKIFFLTTRGFLETYENSEKKDADFKEYLTQRLMAMQIFHNFLTLMLNDKKKLELCNKVDDKNPERIFLKYYKILRTTLFTTLSSELKNLTIHLQRITEEHRYEPDDLQHDLQLFSYKDSQSLNLLFKFIKGIDSFCQAFHVVHLTEQEKNIYNDAYSTFVSLTEFKRTHEQFIMNSFPINSLKQDCEEAVLHPTKYQYDPSLPFDHPNHFPDADKYRLEFLMRQSNNSLLMRKEHDNWWLALAFRAARLRKATVLEYILNLTGIDPNAKEPKKECLLTAKHYPLPNTQTHNAMATLHLRFLNDIAVHYHDAILLSILCRIITFRNQQLQQIQRLQKIRKDPKEQKEASQYSCCFFTATTDDEQVTPQSQTRRTKDLTIVPPTTSPYFGAKHS